MNVRNLHQRFVHQHAACHKEENCLGYVVCYTVMGAFVWRRIRGPCPPSNAAICISLWSVSPLCHLAQLEARSSEGIHVSLLSLLIPWGCQQFPEEPQSPEDPLSQANGSRSVPHSKGGNLNCTSKKNKVIPFSLGQSNGRSVSKDTSC